MNKAFRYMDTSPKGVKEFMKACEEMCVSKYVIAEGKISNVLQTITASKMVYDVIEQAIDGFDFSASLSQNISNGEINSPENAREQIALVFCLMFAFDTRQTDLKQFLHTYFSGENPNEEFTAFCDKLIVPFANYVLKAIKEGGLALPKTGGQPSSSLASEKPSSPQNANAKSEGPSNVQKERAAASAIEFAAAVQGNEIMLPKEKEEMLFIVHSLYKAVKADGVDGVKLTFLSLKNTLKNSNAYPALSVSFADLSESILDAGISVE